MGEGFVGRWVGERVAGVLDFSGRRPKAMLLFVLLLSSVAVVQLRDVRFDENLIKILPKGNPNTEANLNVTRDFPGHHTYTALILKTDEQKWVDANRKLPYRTPPEQLQESRPQEKKNGYVGANNISDEVYIRGMEELYQFYHARLPPGVTFFMIGWNSHVKLVNWSNEKAQKAPGTNVDASFSIPDTSPAGERQYQLAWETVIQVAPSEVTTQASPDWSNMRAVFTYEPPPQTQKAISDLGAWFEQTTQAYIQAADDEKLSWDVFDTNALSIFDSKVVVDAHQNELAKKNLLYLGPLVAIFVLAALWVAFRSWKALLIGSVSLILGVVWTFGLMATFDIPLNVLNLAVVPLILGVGIDFSIHIINEFVALKSQGFEDRQAFREVGRRGGFSMFIATLTTVAGLVIMIYSPSELISQLGIVSSIALAIVYVLSIAFIPASLALLGSRGMAARYQPSNFMPKFANWVNTRRAFCIFLAVLITGVTLVAGQLVINETFGNPARNFPPDDHIREQQETANRLLYGREDPDVVSNWMIIEGDITDPAVHRYLMQLSRQLARSDLIRDDSVVSITNLVARWVAIKNGSPMALLNIGQEVAQPGSTYPSTKAAIKQNLDEIYASPFNTYASLFVNRDYTISVVLIDLKGGTTFDEASYAWDTVWAIVEELEPQRPDSIRVSMGGYTAFSYLFITYEMPWVQAMAYVTMFLVAALVLVFTRDWKATVVVTLLNVLSTVWWFGLLPFFDIGLSVTLTIPLIFIYCIGSDYGLHLALDLRRGDGFYHTFATVGKAVLFSAATDIGAFALFIPMENLMMRKSMIATSLAILVIFFLTMLVVPLFYRRDAPLHTRVQVVAATRATHAAPVRNPQSGAPSIARRD